MTDERQTADPSDHGEVEADVEAEVGSGSDVDADDELDVTAMPTERLEAATSELAAHLAAATCRLLTMIAELDRRQAWASWGLASCAHWLSWHCGLGLGSAREHVRVARAMADLPLLRAEFAAGRLSYSKVRAVTRISTPALERDLVHLALASTASQVERWVRGYRRTGKLESTDPEPYSLSWRFDDGAMILAARLAPDDGALLLAALEFARTALGTPPPGVAPCDSDESSVETPEPPESRRSPEAPESESSDDAVSDVSAGTSEDVVGIPMTRVNNLDALMYVARSALSAAPIDVSGSDRYQVVLHVDRDALFAEDSSPDDGSADGVRAMRAGRCELRDTAGVPVETAWRVACDSMLRAMYHDASGRPVNFGRNRRLVSPAQRRLLLERDGGCVFPGCTHRRYLHAHHIVHWLRGGATDLDNLILLCSRHHRAVHEGGMSVGRSSAGELEFRAADDRLIKVAPQPEVRTIPLEQLIAPLHRPPTVGPSTLAGWSGDRLHLDEVVAMLKRGQARADRLAS